MTSSNRRQMAGSSAWSRLVDQIAADVTDLQATAGRIDSAVLKHEADIKARLALPRAEGSR
jgi:hypothetical protein